MREPASIRKRDGRLEPFRRAKIEAAVRKAFAAVGEPPDARAEQVAAAVVAGVVSGATPGVEEVQDLVERALIDARLPEVAKAYILYRRKHAEVRDTKTMLGVEDDLHLTVNAITVLERRYLRKNERGEVVETPIGMMRRVARAVAAPEAQWGGAAAAALWADRFERMLRDLDFLPNSPTLMNAGTDLGNLAACFVLPVPDTMDGIFEAVKRMALVHQSGGGTGMAFSRLRPKSDVVASTGGVASGPVSFMGVFDAATDVVKQGGRRRGANMAILRVDHPDILDFITAKSNPARLQNFNISVGATDAFMRAVETGESYDLVNPRSGAVVERRSARDVFDMIVAMAWQTGDPGLVFLDAMNRDNPTPDVGSFEATNPCFAGHCRLATDRGILTFDELFREQSSIRVVTDNRVMAMHAFAGGGRAAAVRLDALNGTTLRPAVPVFKTRENEPVFCLETEHGFEVNATRDHRLFTPGGPKRLDELKPGDEILIQSGPGVWSKDDRLPPFTPEGKFAARVARGEAKPPTRWSREIGEVLGWVIGDGYVSIDLPKGRTVPNYAVGLVYGDEEKRSLAPRFANLIREWTGIAGSVADHNGVSHHVFRSAFYYFLTSLGVTDKHCLEKTVPAAIWSAPREAVRGFLAALFTADGSIQVGDRTRGSVRLANSSLRLLKEVQLLLLNEGIVSRLYRRRGTHPRMLPDSRRIPREYMCAPQYELIIARRNRARFTREIGFLTDSKQRKAEAFESGLAARGAYREPFTARIRSIAPVESTDVYCTTERATNSVVVNGFVAANCGEQPLLPYEACNLGSINLARMISEGTVAWDRLGRTVDLSVRFLDDVIDAARYPFPEITAIVRANRKIGLGIMGWAEMLVRLGIPYTAPEALDLADRVMRFVHERAHAASRDLAKERGAFPNFATSRHAERGDPPLRNATVTTIAPTGTISIIAGTSSGVEPLYAVAYVRNVLGGEQLLEVNPLFEAEARRLGALSPALLRRVLREGSLARMDEVPDELKRVFVTAADVPPEWHVRMQAAFQRWCDNGVSKTVNLPHEATQADVRRVYELAWKLGCKGVTVFRSGSKADQVLAQRGESEAAALIPDVNIDPGACRVCAT